MRKSVATLCLVLVLLCSGCQGDRDQIHRLTEENKALQGEVSRLKAERDELKFGAARLVQRAEAAYRAGEWANAKLSADQLLREHPGAPESARAQELIMLTGSELEKEAAAAAAKVEQERAEAKHRIAAAVSKMRSKHDEIDGITWYYDKTTTKYTDTNSFHLYIGKPDGGASPWLRLRLQYAADDWLFIQSFLVVADGERFEHPAAQFKRDNDSGIWEWYDDVPSSTDLKMVRAVIKAKKATIRYIGRQYRNDREITAAQKAALQNVLDAYEGLREVRDAKPI